MVQYNMINGIDTNIEVIVVSSKTWKLTTAVVSFQGR